MMNHHNDVKDKYSRKKEQDNEYDELNEMDLQEGGLNMPKIPKAPTSAELGANFENIGKGVSNTMGSINDSVDMVRKFYTRTLVSKKVKEIFHTVQANLCKIINNETFVQRLQNELVTKFNTELEEMAKDFKNFVKSENEKKDEEGKEGGERNQGTKTNVFYRIYDVLGNQMQLFAPNSMPITQDDSSKQTFTIFDRMFIKFKIWEEKQKMLEANVDSIENYGILEGGGHENNVEQNLVKNMTPSIKKGGSEIGQKLSNTGDWDPFLDPNASGKMDEYEKEVVNKIGTEGGADLESDVIKSGIVVALKKLNLNLSDKIMDRLIDKIFFGLFQPKIFIVQLMASMSKEERKALLEELSGGDIESLVSQYPWPPLNAKVGIESLVSQYPWPPLNAKVGNTIQSMINKMMENREEKTGGKPGKKGGSSSLPFSVLKKTKRLRKKKKRNHRTYKRIRV